MRCFAQMPGPGMKKVVPMMLVAVLGLYHPGNILAQEGPPDGRPRGGEMRPGGPGGGFIFGRRMRDDLSEAEKTVILDFIKKHSPQRWKAYEDISNPDFKARVERMMVMRNRAVLAAQNRGEAELFNLLVARVEAEDEAWALSRTVRDKPDGEEAAAARETLHAIAQRLVDLELAEREIRIARLREMVARQERNLEDDKKDPSKAVEARYNELLTGEGRSRPMGGPPGGPFPGRPGDAPGMPPEMRGDVDEELPPPLPPPPPAHDEPASAPAAEAPPTTQPAS